MFEIQHPPLHKPSMDQKVLTHDCIRFAVSNIAGTVVSDTQLRQKYLDEYEEDPLSFKQILLDCDDEKQTARLSNREWPSKDIDAQIRWASLLREDVHRMEYLSTILAPHR